MGLWSKKCKICGVKYHNNEVVVSGAGWMCKRCARDQGLAKRQEKQDRKAQGRNNLADLRRLLKRPE